MEVTVVETTRIQPSKPPFAEPHTLSLSHLDTDPNLNVTFRYLRVYASSSSNPTTTAATNNTKHPIFHVISHGLSASLVHYYPLAASLRPCKDGRLEVYCCLDQLGLPLVNATASTTLEEVNYLDDPDPEFVHRLAPDAGPDEALANPLALQVTVFGCGGFVVGACVHHALCDGIGGTQFFTAVAELARGADHVRADPVWARTELLGPRDPPRVGGVVTEFMGVERGRLQPYGNHVVGGLARVRFDVKEKWMAQLKKELLERSGSTFTTFEALGAFIWRAKVKASGIPDNEEVKFAYSINVRKIVKPQLPAGYWGNGCVPMYVKAPARDVTRKPLWETANLIKNSKRNASDEYVRSFIDLQALHCKDGMVTAGNRVCGFTDWRHLGHSSVDFGWGGPVNVVPLSARLLGSVEPCFFLPYSLVGARNREEEDGFKVLVVLKEADVPGFNAEMERLSRQEF